MAEINKNDIIDSSIVVEFEKLALASKSVAESFTQILKTGETLNTGLKKATTTRQELNKANEKAVTNSKNLVTSTTKLTNLQTSYTKSMVALNKQKVKSQKAKEKELKTNKALAGSYNKLNSDLKKHIASYQALDAAQRKSAGGKALLKNIKNQDKALKKLDAQMGRSQRSVGKYQNALSGMAGAFGFIGAIGLFANALKNSVKKVIDYSKAQSKLASVMGKTKAEIVDLTKDTQKYGAVTEFTATQVTELQTELAKLGFTANEIQNMTKAILDLASATGADLAAAAKTTGVALKAFGLDARDAADVTATLAVATTKSALSFEDYETILSTLGPVAKAYGFSLEDTIALTGKLKDAGFDASSAATATRNILLNLADANGKLAKSLGKPVKSLDDMGSAFAELRDGGIDLAETLELTDKRSVAAFNTFLNGAEDLTVLRDSITDVSAELQEMVDVKLDNLAGDMTKLGSAWEGFILSIEQGDGVFAKATRGIIQFSTSVITALANLDIALSDINDMTESEFQRTYTIMEQGIGANGRAFQVFMKSFESFSANDLIVDQSKIRKEIEELGFSTKEAARLYDEYVKRKEDSTLKSLNTSAAFEDEDILIQGRLEALKKVDTYESREGIKKLIAYRARLNNEYELWKINEEKKAAIEKEAAKAPPTEEEKKVSTDAADKAQKERQKANDLEEKEYFKLLDSKEKIKKDSEKRSSALTKRLISEELLDASNMFIEKQKAAEDSYKKGEISAEQYSAELLRISDETLAAQIKNLESFAEFYEKGSEERKQIETVLAEYLKKLNDSALAQVGKNKEEEVEIWTEADRQKLENTAETLAKIGAFADSAFNLYKVLLDREIADLEKAQAYELELAGDNEEAKTAIDERYAAEKAKIMHDQAVADKASAAFSIAINTAVAAMMAYAQLGPVGGTIAAAFIVALGAVELAAVLLEPIPQFDEGTKSAPKGGFIAGEKRPEFITNKGKTTLVTKPTLFGDSYAGAEITSGFETDQILNNGLLQSLRLNGVGINDKKDSLELSKLEDIEKAIKKSRSGVIFNKRGITEFHRQSMQKTNRLDRYIS